MGGELLHTSGLLLIYRTLSTLASLLKPGLCCKLRVNMDSSAAIGICKRTGVGKVRHLDTRLLLLQERVQCGTIKVVKVAGAENPADLMTKHLGADDISAHLVRLSCWPREGRAQLAPRTE